MFVNNNQKLTFLSPLDYGHDISGKTADKNYSMTLFGCKFNKNF